MIMIITSAISWVQTCTHSASERAGQPATEKSSWFLEFVMQYQERQALLTLPQEETGSGFKRVAGALEAVPVGSRQ